VTIVAAIILAIGAAAGAIYLMIRFPVLFPLLVFLLGLGALSCVVWQTGVQDAVDNFFWWAAVLGIVMSALQLRRTLAPRTRPTPS
jgi:hypothetical protein